MAVELDQAGLVRIAPSRSSHGAVIPIVHLARIRTLVKYGMTIAHVAAIYGVDAGEIAKLLGKA